MQHTFTHTFYTHAESLVVDYKYGNFCAIHNRFSVSKVDTDSGDVNGTISNDKVKRFTREREKNEYTVYVPVDRTMQKNNPLGTMSTEFKVVDTVLYEKKKRFHAWHSQKQIKLIHKISKCIHFHCMTRNTLYLQYMHTSRLTLSIDWHSDTCQKLA